MDIRTFSQALDVAETTTRNYLNRGTKPGIEYLEKISKSFSVANMHWLITGNGEPLLTGGNSQASHIKKIMLIVLISTTRAAQ